MGVSEDREALEVAFFNLSIALSEVSASFRSFAAVVAEEEAREVAQHPDLAEWMRMDGFYL